MKNINEKFVAVETGERLERLFDVFEHEDDAKDVVAERNAEIVRDEFSGDEDAWLNDPHSTSWLVMPWGDFAEDYPEKAELYLEDN